VVDQAVDRGHSHRRVGEDLIPFAERLIAGGDQAAALVALGDELEQNVGLGLVLAHLAKIVEDEHIEAVESSQGSGEREVASRCLELLHEVGGAGQEHPFALIDEGGADRCGEMGFAGAARSNVILPGVR